MSGREELGGDGINKKTAVDFCLRAGESLLNSALKTIRAVLVTFHEDEGESQDGFIDFVEINDIVMGANFTHSGATDSHIHSGQLLAPVYELKTPGANPVCFD